MTIHLRTALSGALLVFGFVLWQGFETGTAAFSRELPVLLVHGFCSDSDGAWGDTEQGQGLIANLQPSPVGSVRFGWGVTKLFAAKPDANSLLTVYWKDSFDKNRSYRRSNEQFSQDPSKRLFTIDFFEDEVDHSFNKLYVNDTGINHKAAELAAVIKEVTRISGSEKVIIVAHSLGGLAARAYVQGLASADDVSYLRYQDDVGKIIMVDTPNGGSNLALPTDPPDLPFLSDCITETSRDKDDLKPSGKGDGPIGTQFLSRLNNQNSPSIPDGAKATYSGVIPVNVMTTAIVSYDPRTLANGDGVVGYTQQRLTSLSPYAASAFYDYVRDYANPVEAGVFGVGSFTEIHTKIHHFPQTIALVRKLIDAFDAPARATMSVNPFVTQGDVVTIDGRFFTPRGVVRPFVRTDSQWAALNGQSADDDGNFRLVVPTSCADRPGTRFVVARDESAWLKGDYNGDGIINTIDYSLLNAKWFKRDSFIDTSLDGIVNSIDFSILNAHWFTLGPAGRVAPEIGFTVVRSPSCP
jgi:pimeloyl-ACP methyl ester carboxylesterase